MQVNPMLFTLISMTAGIGVVHILTIGGFLGAIAL